MRVLAVLPAIGPEGGAEQSFAALAGPLRDRGVELHLALFDGDAAVDSDTAMLRMLRNDGVTIHDLSNCSTLPARVLAIRRLAREVDADLVHAVLFQATLPAQLASIGRCAPLLITWAVTPNSAAGLGEFAGGRWKRRSIQLLDAGLGRLCGAQFHAVTEGVADAVAESQFVPPERVHVGERGRVAAKFDARPDRAALLADLSLPDSSQVVLAIGRQDPQKGYASLLEAFDSVAVAHPDARLLIAGREGPETPLIRRHIEAAPDGDRVMLLGQRSDVASLLAIADLVVCSSWREGAAGSLIEAMASATAIVTVELKGLEGVFTPGEDAIVVPRAALSQAIGSVLDDSDLRARLATAAQRTYRRRFTIERAADRMSEIYRDVVEDSA